MFKCQAHRDHDTFPSPLHICLCHLVPLFSCILAIVQFIIPTESCLLSTNLKMLTSVHLGKKMNLRFAQPVASYYICSTDAWDSKVPNEEGSDINNSSVLNIVTRFCYFTLYSRSVTKPWNERSTQHRFLWGFPNSPPPLWKSTLHLPSCPSMLSLPCLPIQGP